MLIIDTGVLLAAADGNDQAHRRAAMRSNGRVLAGVHLEHMRPVALDAEEFTHYGFR